MLLRGDCRGGSPVLCKMQIEWTPPPPLTPTPLTDVDRNNRKLIGWVDEPIIGSYRFSFYYRLFENLFLETSNKGYILRHTNERCIELEAWLQTCDLSWNNRYFKLTELGYHMLVHSKLYRNIKPTCYDHLLFDSSYGISDCTIDNQSVLLSR